MWNYAYTVPENKKVRVIVHTDCKNEADDQYAVAHHLMTPRFDVKGLVAGHFWKNPQQYGELGTAQASYDEIIKVMELMGLKNQYPVKLGAPRALEDENTPIDSEGARFIIEEAMKEDKRPLYIACQGAITDVASALLMKPEIAERMTVIWIGGADYPKGGFEFNLMMDINAANVVFSSKVPVWQVPMSLYKVMAVSLAELQLKVRPCGKIGKYLFEQLVDFNHVAAKYEMDWPQGEIWGLGDQGTIAVLMEELEKVSYDMVSAPRIAEDMTYIHGQDNREIRVYKYLDARLTLEDFFAAHPKAVLGAVFNSRVYQVAGYLQETGHHLEGLVGYDLLPKNVEYLKSGEVNYLIGQRPGLQGYCGVKALCDHVVFKRPVTGVKYMPIDILMKENINFYFEFE